MASVGVIQKERPDPPAELTDEQADEWRSIVGRMPADWFPRETFALLTQYCRHVTRARKLARMIDAADMEEVKAFRDLLRSEEEQSRAIASLATKLRISQQTQQTRAKKPGADIKKPWEAESA